MSRSTTKGPLAEVSSLRVRRGKFELFVEDWKIPPGRIIGVVGPNGAGKTTLLETLAGMRPQSDGQVQVFGMDPWNNPIQVRSQMGFMSDDTPLFALPIGRLLSLVSGYYKSWDQEFALELLERFELDPSRSTSALSRGQTTRVRLLVAMAFKPKLLLLDEPAAGLDLSGRRSLLSTVLDVVRDPDRSVIISSHLLQDIERIADDLLVIHQGQVIQQGPTDQLVQENQTLEEALLEWGTA